MQQAFEKKLELKRRQMMARQQPSPVKGEQPSLMVPHVTIPKGMIGFPKSNRVKLRYVESVTMSGAAGAMATYQFSLNGLFDPNITGTGHQPLGFDQWAVFYNNYYVERAQFRLTPFVTSAGVNPYFGWYITDDTTITATTAVQLIEQGLSKFQIRVNGATENSVTSMAGGISLQKWFGIKDLSAAITNIGALVTANPTNQAYLTLFEQDIGVAGTAAVRVLVEIDYYVVFTEPKELPTS